MVCGRPSEYVSLDIRVGLRFEAVMRAFSYPRLLLIACRVDGVYACVVGYFTIFIGVSLLKFFDDGSCDAILYLTFGMSYGWDCVEIALVLGFLVIFFGCYVG